MPHQTKIFLEDIRMITKDMLIIDILNQEKANELAQVLVDAGMHCLGCLAAHGETLEQAAAVHGIDADELVAKLNAVL